MSLRIKTVTLEDIQKCNYKPDEHTVSLKDHGTWYAIERSGLLISFLCIRKQRNEYYIGEVYTAPNYRKQGLFYTLLDTVVNKIYKGYSISTHALETSRRGFEACGFKQYAYREFKYGNQYWLRRDGKKL